jgi:hypothetical protein
MTVVQSFPLQPVFKTNRKMPFIALRYTARFTPPPLKWIFTSTGNRSSILGCFKHKAGAAKRPAFCLRVYPNINKVFYSSYRYISYADDALGEKHETINRANPLAVFTRTLDQPYSTSSHLKLATAAAIPFFSSHQGRRE